MNILSLISKLFKKMEGLLNTTISFTITIKRKQTIFNFIFEFVDVFCLAYLKFAYLINEIFVQATALALMNYNPIM